MFTEGHIPWNKGLTKRTDERLKRLSEHMQIVMRGKKRSVRFCQKMKKIRLGRSLSMRHREAIGQGLKGRKLSKEQVVKRTLTRRKRSKERGYWRSEEANKRVGEKNKVLMKKKWQDPEYVAKQMRSRGVRPNNPEKFLTLFLNKIQPNEWKYVGDGQFILGGRCPDFINVNGKKKLIELFGEWYHSRGFADRHDIKYQSPKDRINHFKQFGFDTLVVWEHELRDLNGLKQKVLGFGGKQL